MQLDETPEVSVSVKGYKDTEQSSAWGLPAYQERPHGFGKDKCLSREQNWIFSKKNYWIFAEDKKMKGFW